MKIVRDKEKPLHFEQVTNFSKGNPEEKASVNIVHAKYSTMINSPYILQVISDSLESNVTINKLKVALSTGFVTHHL